MTVLYAKEPYPLVLDMDAQQKRKVYTAPSVRIICLAPGNIGQLFSSRNIHMHLLCS